jgi:acetyl esterase
MRDAFDQTGPFDLQLLLYPAVDLRRDMIVYESRRRDEDPTLRSANLATYFADYAGESDPTDPRHSPITADSLAGLPPALVIVLSVDPLRDEAVAYADMLRRSGVRTELVEFDNLTHGFLHFAGIIPAAAVATEEVIERLQFMLRDASLAG